MGCAAVSVWTGIAGSSVCPPAVFFFNDTATTEIYTLSLHDALPTSSRTTPSRASWRCSRWRSTARSARSEEHTSELQSRGHLVCRLLLEKKKRRRHQHGYALNQAGTWRQVLSRAAFERGT